MMNKETMPKEEGMDHTLGLLREGYMYISNRCHSFHSDIFATKLLGKKAICMRGKEAAELFYDEEKFKRNKAIPNHIVQSFFGENSVQTLDATSHRHRKDMLMSVMTQEKINELIDIVKEAWNKTLHRWEQMEEVAFYEDVQKLLCKAACEWVGIAIDDNDLNKRTKALASLFEAAASIGPAYWSARNARNSLNRWISELIEGIRSDNVRLHPETIIYKFAFSRDLDGNLFDVKTAAVEVVNLLRPIVAISIFINFLMLALYHHPEEKEKLQTKDKQYFEMFVQEVRRFYPFFPFVTALVKKDFMWGPYTFKEGTLTILDIYGTNHDPELWQDPNLFNPERFRDWEESPFRFIPQGGGDYWLGHRCAGEWVTVEIMKVSLDYLVNQITYDVPDQDLSFSMVSIPSIPHSKIVLENVQRK